ncbi:MAG: DUF4105 domain-containing protein [Oligoflexia bacterium]|nr:DUF4105 domain-containing protein [Oligoflexia bacterium]
MTSWKYADQCADTSIKRPAVNVHDDGNTITFRIFITEADFWTATVSKNAVRQVMLETKELMPKIAGYQLIHGDHAEIRFILDPKTPMVLNPQGTNAGNAPATPVAVTDFMWSMEYVAPKGVPYSAFIGEENAYSSVDRLIATRDREAEQESSPDQPPIHQFELKMSPETKARLLDSAVKKSEATGYKQPYKTFSDNCVTSAFDLIDEAIRYNKPYQMSLVHDVLEDPDKSMAKALEQRGLGPSPLATLNEELSHAQEPCQR